MARESNCRIDQIIDRNEQVHRSPDAIAEQLDRLWAVMAACIDRGCMSPGILPGSLHIRRRAPGIYQKLTGGTSLIPSQWLEQHAQEKLKDPLQQLDWVSLFALAVNEENAAGGQVVTAPTNGAAGVIPAVLGYYVYLVPDPGHPDFDRTISDREGVHRFLKTAGAIGMLYKRNASLSAAEMGCQGEVGVACSMAAAGLAACMGGTIDQIENAAEIGMEHNLGLTCDPIAGLVQVPCIERNTMGATKAINAARLAVLYGDGKHFVSLDRVIETMRQTGVDMQSKYKETSLGGLAVNVVDC
jgi:L-serine dehydratase